MTPLSLTYLGTHWEWAGDLSYLTHPDGREARVYVDSVGETWVDVRVVPEGGWFHSERVAAYRALNGAAAAERELKLDGFGSKRVGVGAKYGRVRERGF